MDQIEHLIDDPGWDMHYFKNFLNKYYKKTELDKLTQKEGRKQASSLNRLKIDSNMKRDKTLHVTG